jgi:hypothetical protein
MPITSPDDGKDMEGIRDKDDSAADSGDDENSN